jgi:DNA-directed RNA polymerase subunit M/transcription elongation factor TFIIS
MSDGNNEEEILTAARLGRDIEKCIFNQFKNTESKYKNRIRSRVSNLSDSKNIELKQNLLNGKIKVEAIAVMSAEEMASNQLKELRKNMKSIPLMPINCQKCWAQRVVYLSVRNVRKTTALIISCRSNAQTNR